MSGADAGKPPIRVVIGKPGLDGHDVGAKLVCRALMEAGMEVIYTGLRQAPEAIVQTALQEGAGVLGLSILSGAHEPLCRRVKAELERAGIDVLWLVGGNVPPAGREELRALGVDAVFATGAPLAEIVKFVQENARR